MKSSGPMSAMKKTWVTCFLVVDNEVDGLGYLPALLGVPSTFLSYEGWWSFLVLIPSPRTVLGLIKHSVAPLSRSAFRLTLLSLVLSAKGTKIAYSLIDIQN